MTDELIDFYFPFYIHLLNKSFAFFSMFISKKKSYIHYMGLIFLSKIIVARALSIFIEMMNSICIANDYFTLSNISNKFCCLIYKEKEI